MLALMLLLSAISFAIAIGLTYLARSYGRRRALLDSQGAIGQRKLQRAVPNIGGIAIFWAIVVPVLAGLAMVWFMPDQLAGWVPAAAIHFDGIRDQTWLALGLIGVLFVLHITGLIDDRKPISAWPKLGLMLVAASVLVIVFDVRMLTLLDGMAGGRWASILLTILWLVAVTNAMNFMDNMDGLSAGVGAVAGSMFLAAALLAGQWFVAAMLALLVGALLGFLVFNYPRRGGATIFMGDGGSLVLGFLLAFLTVRITYTTLPQVGENMESNAWFGVFMPLCVLAIPLYDMTSVILIRRSQGTSPLVGDRQHFSHRLLAAGLGVPRALAVICGCTAITGISGIMLTFAESWFQAMLIAVQVLLVLVVMAIYEHGKGWPLREREQ